MKKEITKEFIIYMKNPVKNDLCSEWTIFLHIISYLFMVKWKLMKSKSSHEKRLPSWFYLLSFFFSYELLLPDIAFHESQQSNKLKTNVHIRKSNILKKKKNKPTGRFTLTWTNESWPTLKKSHLPCMFLHRWALFRELLQSL